MFSPRHFADIISFLTAPLSKFIFIHFEFVSRAHSVAGAVLGWKTSMPGLMERTTRGRFCEVKQGAYLLPLARCFSCSCVGPQWIGIKEMRKHCFKNML